MNEKYLSDASLGSCYIIKKINVDGSIKRRLLDIGMIEGTKVENVLVSPFGDPMAFLIRGAVIALRNEVTSKIVVEALA
ncbi:MAG: ferrous iron transport protein A [Firmicutes bacterium]|nr:ferrous iron transport protein A [Bacillota bacterium]